MAKQPYIPLYIGDWKKDADCLSISAQGALLNLIFKLHDAPKRGVFEANLRILSLLFKTDLETTKEIFSEIFLDTKVLDFDNIEDGKFCIKSRRMLRESDISETRSSSGKKSAKSKSSTKRQQTVNKASTKVEQNPDNDNDIDNANEDDIEAIKKVFFDKNFQFFKTSRNHRVLQEIHKLSLAQVEDYFVRFFDEKIDIGELNNKSPGDLVKHFSLWLPKILAKGEPPTSGKETKLEASKRRNNQFLNNFQQ